MDLAEEHPPDFSLLDCYLRDIRGIETTIVKPLINPDTNVPYARIHSLAVFYDPVKRAHIVHIFMAKNDDLDAPVACEVIGFSAPESQQYDVDRTFRVIGCDGD